MAAKYPNLLTRFLRYVKTPTRSDENSDSTPSTPTQVAFAKTLKQEMEQLGLSNVRLQAQSGYVIGELPSNLPAGKTAPVIGFLAHMDTADFNDQNVNPQIVKNYDGQSVIKLGQSGYVLDPAEFPNLHNYAGHDLITTDGTTLLGADDKSGIAEIMSAVEYLTARPEIQHGTLKFAVGPDEEIGTGADKFDVDDFGADFAYTVDGGPLGELEYETFNAAAAKITIHGKNVHPATAKGVMINALQLAIDLHNQLPADAVPEKTDGRQGFFHLLALSGTVDEAKMDYIIRDHDRAKFAAKKALLKEIVANINAQFATPRVELDMYDQYYNMKEVMEQHMDVVDLAQAAMKQLGITPVIYPVRGGTDGSKLSFMGLPTPNLFAGGENMHGRFEYVSLQVMEQAADLIVKLSQLAVK